MRDDSFGEVWAVAYILGFSESYGLMEARGERDGVLANVNSRGSRRMKAIGDSIWCDLQADSR